MTKYKEVGRLKSFRSRISSVYYQLSVVGERFVLFDLVPPVTEVNSTRTEPHEGSAVISTGIRRASVVMKIRKL